MSGHSKWANIKHKKAKLDARRGKAWSKCARAIIVAAKSGGGDPASNLTLRYAIDEAKAANMPKDTIENAIKKGSGELGGESYESMVYEGYGPAGVAMLLEILTDNRNRTAGEIRKIFEKQGGNLGSSGCVAYIFTSRGQVFVNRQVDEDTLTAAVLEAGAEDVIGDDPEVWQVVCPPSDFIKVREAIEAANLPIESAGITMLANTTVTVSGDDARRVLALIEALEEHDDVQKVYANFEIPDEEMAALS
jgi:YebC/PmpR family DNA-binding regulatory protein